MIKTKNVRDKRSADDGLRVLVMRLWPRGIKKTQVDVWMKELGCSRELIKDWKNGRVTWHTFQKRYFDEMNDPSARKSIGSLAERDQGETVTLLCSCRDESRCHRILLKELIEKATS